MKLLSLRLTIQSMSVMILGALSTASNAQAFPASTATTYAETSAFVEQADDGVTVVGNDLCIDIPITLLECRHTYGDPAKTEITKHALRAGLTKAQVTAAGADICFKAGGEIRKRLDREAGGKGKSKPKYPEIKNVIGGYDKGRLKLCIPLPFSFLFGGSSEPTDSAPTDSVDAETASSTFGSLADGSLEPSELTEEQIEELRALAGSEDFTSTEYIEINEPVASN